MSRDALTQIGDDYFALLRLGLTRDDATRLAALVELGAARAKTPDTLDPVSRSDREADVEDWLSATSKHWEANSTRCGPT